MQEQKNQTADFHAFSTLRQRGFTLVMVMAIMMILALLVIAGAQSSNTEMRISANDADRKEAFALAEEALRIGEQAAAGFSLTASGDENKAANLLKADFKYECTQGKCLPADGTGSAEAKKAAWERSKVFTGDLTNSIAASEVVGGFRPPRYIVEYLGDNDTDGRVFRVTARAWGKNENTVVTLQSYIAAPKPTTP